MEAQKRVLCLRRCHHLHSDAGARTISWPHHGSGYVTDVELLYNASLPILKIYSHPSTIAIELATMPPTVILIRHAQAEHSTYFYDGG